MPYISPDNEYPRYPGDIQIVSPGWEVGDPLPEGWVFVEETPIPEIEEGQTFYAGEPEEVDGTWRHTWVVRDLSEEELSVINAPKTAKEKLASLGFSDAEITAIFQNRLF